MGFHIKLSQVVRTDGSPPILIRGEGMGSTQARAYRAALVALMVDLDRCVGALSGEFYPSELVMEIAKWDASKN